MSKDELRYRLDHGTALWDGVIGKHTAGLDVNLKGRIDRRTCNSTGEMCDRCYHRKNCPRECGHLSGEKKWNW